MGTIFITGAGRGLGLALAEAALERGDVVIGTLRDRERGRALLALAERHPMRAHALFLDVADEASCAALTAQTRERVASIDVLVNNAGVNSKSGDIPDARTAHALESLSSTALTRMMATNALGPLFVTRALAPLLHTGSVVLNVSSRRGSLAHKDTGGNYGYCMSKAALNMATRALAQDLLPSGVVVAAVHPGAVRTAMAQNDAFTEPSVAARGLLALVDGLEAAHAGRFLELDSLRTGRDHAW